MSAIVLWQLMGVAPYFGRGLPNMEADSLIWKLAFWRSASLALLSKPKLPSRWSKWSRSSQPGDATRASTNSCDELTNPDEQGSHTHGGPGDAVRVAWQYAIVITHTHLPLLRHMGYILY